jgi:hypothetical protein
MEARHMEPGITERPAEQKKTVGSLAVEYCLTAEDYAAWSIHAWEKLIARQSRTFLARILRLIIWLAICLLAVLCAGTVVGLVRDVWRSGALTKNHLGILFGAFILLMLLLGLLLGVGPKSFARRLARHAAMRQIRFRAKQMPERNQKAVPTPDKVIECCFAHCGKQETILGIRSREEGDTCTGTHRMTGGSCGAWRPYGHKATLLVKRHLPRLKRTNY